MRPPVPGSSAAEGAGPVPLLTARHRWAPSLGRNIASTYGARGATVLVSFLLFPAVARDVGLTMFGLWLFVNSLAMFFGQDFGLSTALVRYVADAHTRGDRSLMSGYASSILAFLLGAGGLGSVAFAVAIAVFWPHLDVPPGQARTVIAIIAMVIVSSFLISFPLHTFRLVVAAVQRYDVFNLLTVLQAACRLVAVLAVLQAGLGIVAVVMAESLVGVAGALAGVVICRRVVPGIEITRRHMKTSTVRDMAPFAGRIFVMQTAALVILQTDNLVIGTVLSAASVTLYSAAFRIYQVCRELTNSFTAPLIPDASRRAVTAGGELGSLLVTGTKYANAVMVLVSVPLLLFSGEVLVAWAGDRFASAASVLQVLLVGLLINNNHLVAVSLLSGVGNVREYARYHATWAVLNLFLSILLAGRFGLVGVALGTTLPLIALEPLYVRAAVRAFGVPLRSFLGGAVCRVAAPAVLAGTPLAMVVLWTRVQGFAGVLAWSSVWAVLFIGAFVRLGLTADERARLRHRLALRRDATPRASQE